MISYLRFALPEIVGEIVSAQLRLYCTDSGDRVEIRNSPNTSWAESDPTWHNQLPVEAEAVGMLTPDSADRWVEIDVLKAVSSGSTVTFALLPTDSNGVDFSSRESENAPQLVIRYLAAAQTSQTLEPVADTYVDSAHPDQNFGTAPVLLYDTASVAYESYLRFDLSDLTGDLRKATLRLYSVNGGDPGQLYTSSDTSWLESAPTWQRRLPADGAALGQIPTVDKGTWVDLDVTSGVSAADRVTFVLRATGSDGADFHSRESDNRPQLIVEFSDEDLALVASPACGDGRCELDESCANCPQDCGACESACGDGSCTADEDCSSCTTDCGSCSTVIENQYAGSQRWCKVAVHTHPDRTGGEAMVAAHAALGYDLVFFTDHSYDDQTEPVNVDNTIAVSGEEVSTDEGHCNALGNSAYIEPGMTRQETIDAAAKVGAILQVNHPSRYDVTPADLDQLTGLWGIEIKNEQDYAPSDIPLWDSQISQGKRIWGTFSDDAHDVDEVGMGWLMVGTPGDCTRDAVLARMKSGSFYDSEGPTLAITVDGNTIRVSSDTATRLDWYSQNMTPIGTTTGSSGSYTVDGSEVFVRVVATNAAGKMALSMPLFLSTESVADVATTNPTDMATTSLTDTSQCGDGVCEVGEDAQSCSADCDTTTGVERFVDRNNPNASDSNSGTIDQPWLTLTKAAVAAQPGETVWVRAGTYTEGLHVAVSGEAGKRITFAAFPEEQVVLRNRCVTIAGQSHIEIRGFRIEQCDNLEDHDKRGISIVGIENGPVVGDIVITNNHTYMTYSSGIAAWGVPWLDNPGDFRRIVDLLIAGNTIERANEGGYNEQITIANGVEDFEVRYNEIKNGVDASNGGEGIDIKEGCAYGKVHHNVVHDIQRRAYYIDGGGEADYSSPTHDIDFYANIAFNVKNGFAIMSEGGEDVYNIAIYNNLFYEIADDGAFIYDYPLAEGSPGRFWNIRFSNNTFWRCGRSGLDLNSEQLVSGILVQNNIMSTYKDRFSLATEKTNIIGSTPGFVSESTGDFHLQATSPAVDSGTLDDAPTSDLDGTLRPTGAAVDIGAYEYRLP